MTTPIEPTTPHALRQLFQLNEDGSITHLAGRRVGKRADLPSRDGYRRVRVMGRSVAAHRVCWAIHHGAWPLLALDHIDGNRANNRMNNLREATAGQNAANRKCLSGKLFKGFSLHKSAGKFQAQIQGTYLGLFDTENEAAKAYDEAAKRLYGEFAKPNFGNQI